MEAPPLKCSSLGLYHCVRPTYWRADPVRGHPGDLDDESFSIEIGHIDGKSHSDRVHPRTGLEHECSPEAVAPEQAAPSGTAVPGDLHRCENSTVADQPGHP